MGPSGPVGSCVIHEPLSNTATVFLSRLSPLSEGMFKHNVSSSYVTNVHYFTANRTQHMQTIHVFVTFVSRSMRIT